MFTQETFNVVVGGLFTIAGVLMGSFAARRNSTSESKRSYLVDAYSAFFSDVYSLVSHYDPKSFRDVVSSSERLRLFCSKESDELVEKIVRSLAKNADKTIIVNNYLKTLRKLAKKDIGN